MSTLTRSLVNWIDFRDYGPRARRSMWIAWTCIGLFALGCLALMPFSRVSFAAENWNPIGTGLGLLVCAFAICLFVNVRLGGRAERPAIVLRDASRRTELLWRASLVGGANTVLGGLFAYLATSLNLPLQDASLAAWDRAIGFDWLAFLSYANARAPFASVLVFAYHSTGYVVIAVGLWLCARGRGERLAEFLALMCLTAVATGIGLLLLPAAGAYPFFQPQPGDFSSFTREAGVWHLALIEDLRLGPNPVFDMNSAEGIVTFPSFHTVLGIISTWVLRDSRRVFVPILVLNATMIVSTLPEGGHYLVDVLAGAAIAFAAILFVSARPATSLVRPAGVRPALT